MVRSSNSAWLVVLAAAACGRNGFDQIPFIPVDGEVIPDDGIIDGPPDLMRDCAMRLSMDEPAWSGLADEVRDSCGGDDSGRAVNGATTVAGGVRGRAGQFADPMCIEVPDSPRVRGGGALTISAWLYPTALNGVKEYGVLAKRKDFQVQSEYSLFTWTDNTMWVDIDTEDDRFSGGVAFVNDRWQQVTVVYDGAREASRRVTLYVDGQIDRVATERMPSITPFGTTLSVGCLPLNAPAQSFVGKLDEVVLWKRALDAAEVAQWYAATKP